MKLKQHKGQNMKFRVVNPKGYTYGTGLSLEHANELQAEFPTSFIEVES